MNVFKVNYTKKGYAKSKYVLCDSISDAKEKFYIWRDEQPTRN